MLRLIVPGAQPEPLSDPSHGALGLRNRPLQALLVTLGCRVREVHRTPPRAAGLGRGGAERGGAKKGGTRSGSAAPTGVRDHLGDLSLLPEGFHWRESRCPASARASGNGDTPRPEEGTTVEGE